MNPSDFAGVVDGVFPELDEIIRNEIKDRVMLHMLEVMKEKVFAGDTAELNRLLLLTAKEKDIEKRFSLYANQISNKFNSLPDKMKLTIQRELENELTRVMQEIYKAYE